MDSVSNKISLDIQKTGTQVFLSAIRGDTKRHIVISLVDGGAPYSVRGISEAIFTGVKADGKFLYNDCAIDQDSNTIVYEFTEQTTAASGVVNCQIKLVGADGGIISTPTFGIIVADTLYSEQPIVESSLEFNALTAYIADVQKRLGDINIRDLSPTITGNASGSTIQVNDSANWALRSLRIFGRSTQNGTPTPDAPVAIESVGDAGNIAVHINEQDFDVITHNCLRGIPVTDPNLATYIDDNGQMWCADEINLDRGVYVQRVSEYITPSFFSTGNSNLYFASLDKTRNVINTNVISTHFEWTLSSALTSTPIGKMIVRDRADFSGPIVYCASSIATLDEFNAWIKENNVRFLSILATPIETPLSDDEIAQYNALKMNYPTTTITNDENAYMNVEYVVDTKSYIDAKLAGASYISYIDLPSSKWQGSDSLYSQAVSIAGVTENSRVDINPSVEQLAIFHDKDIAFVTENEDGVVTVYCIGQKPANDYTMQVTITEVVANG